jgi:hypothetical protein
MPDLVRGGAVGGEFQRKLWSDDMHHIVLRPAGPIALDAQEMGKIHRGVHAGPPGIAAQSRFRLLIST